MVISVINHLITGKRNKVLFYARKKPQKTLALQKRKEKKSTFSDTVCKFQFLISIYIYICSFTPVLSLQEDHPSKSLTIQLMCLFLMSCRNVCVCVCGGGARGVGRNKRHGLFYLSLFPITSKIENKKLRRGGRRNPSLPPPALPSPRLLSGEKTKKNWEVLMSKARVTKIKRHQSCHHRFL